MGGLSLHAHTLLCCAFVCVDVCPQLVASMLVSSCVRQGRPRAGMGRPRTSSLVHASLWRGGFIGGLARAPKLAYSLMASTRPDHGALASRGQLARCCVGGAHRRTIMMKRSSGLELSLEHEAACYGSCSVELACGFVVEHGSGAFPITIVVPPLRLNDTSRCTKQPRGSTRCYHRDGASAKLCHKVEPTHASHRRVGS